MVLHHSWIGTPAWQIARAVQHGEATAAAVIAEHLAHAGPADRALGSLRTLRAAESLAEAETVDGLGRSMLPLAGVPVLVTDDIQVAGVSPRVSADRAGDGAAERAPLAHRDHEVVHRLRGAGALVLGVARGLGTASGPPPEHGRPVAGAAAAVAAGIVPLALTADLPAGALASAADCGLVGVVPGAPTGGLRCGVLATTVADAALGLAVVSGREPGPLPGAGRLRIALSWRALYPLVGVDRAARAAVGAASRALVDLGHDVVVADPPRAGGRQRERLAGWLAEGRWDLLVVPAGAARLALDPPAVTVPVGLRPDGRPNAVRLVGPPGSDLRLLSVAAQWELLAPWRRPEPPAPTGAGRIRPGHHPGRRGVAASAGRAARAGGVACASWDDRGMTGDPSAAELVTLADIELARDVLEGVVRRTPLEPSRPLTAALGGPAWLKCENLQRAGSYKVRGAYVRIARLTRGGAGPRRGRGQRRQPRAGRRARRRACSAPQATVFMPVGAPLPKVAATKGYGATDRARRQHRRRGAGRGAGVRRADRRGADPPVRPPGRHRRAGHGRAGDPRAVPGRADDRHRRSAAAG